MRIVNTTGDDGIALGARGVKTKLRMCTLYMRS